MFNIDIKIFFINSIFLWQIIVKGDERLTKGATGCSAAKSTIDTVRLSGVFPKDDHFLYATLSAVSDFGTKDVISGAKGIWQTTDANLKKAIGIMNSQNKAQEIQDKLCVDFANAKQDDMDIPMNSLVCAALLVLGKSGDLPVQGKTDEQADWWISAADIADGSYKDTQFKPMAAEFENAGDPNAHANVNCFISCTKQKQNLLFVIDESSSISDRLVQVFVFPVSHIFFFQIKVKFCSD